MTCGYEPKSTRRLVAKRESGSLSLERAPKTGKWGI